MNLLVKPTWRDLPHAMLESETPGLWNKIMGLWVPAAGKTGSGLYDLSGNDQHGTIRQNLADWVISSNGYVLSCDGAGGVHLPDGLSIKTSEPFSIWIYHRPVYGQTVRVPVCFKTDASDPFRVVYAHEAATTYFPVSFGANGTSWVQARVSGLAVSDFESFHSLVISFDGSTLSSLSAWSLYLNGVQRPISISGPLQALTNNSRIAGQQSTYVGSIAAVGLWERKLSRTEILQLANPNQILEVWYRPSVFHKGLSAVSATLRGSCSVVASGIVSVHTRASAASLTGTGTIVAYGKMLVQPKASLNGIGAVTVLGKKTIVRVRLQMGGAGLLAVQDKVVFRAGKTTLSGSANLSARNAGTKVNSIYAFIQGIVPVETGTIPLFLHSQFDNASQELPLFINGLGNTPGTIPSEANIYAFLKTSEMASSGIPLFMPSVASENIESPLFVFGIEGSSSGTLGMFMQGIGPFEAGLPVFIRGFRT